MQCKHIKPDNSQCKANAMQGADFCYLHNPAIPEQEKKQGQSRGGEMRGLRITIPLPEIELKKPDDIVLLLADTINRVRLGEMDIKIANCLGALSGQMIRAMDLVGIPPKLPEPISYEERARRWDEFFGTSIIKNKNGESYKTHPLQLSCQER